MTTLFNKRNATVSADGSTLVFQEEIIRDTLITEVEAFSVITNPDVRTVTDIISTYVEIDEDDLFDYEKTVIPFTYEDGIRSSVIINNGVAEVYARGNDLTPSSRRFARSMSIAEFKIAAEAQVVKLTELEGLSLSWIQMQQPGLHYTANDVYTVFIDNEGKTCFTNGGSQVWYSPSSPSSRPVLNEAMSGRGVDKEPEVPEVVVPEEKPNLLESDAFLRMRELFQNAQ